ncbi:P63C domain-containing protein [Pseudomonas aeruginosa]|uniref:P63C domain-containing protein n=1 Tax=Pseudomonas aeruginosa TaxID=287 RepID=UPI00383BC826
MSDENKPNGKAKGGEARAKALSRNRRSEIAREAARARWDKLKEVLPDLPRATHGGPDKPLRLADHEIPCYVLPDETRLLALSGLQGAIGFAQGGGRGGMSKIATLLGRLEKKGIGINSLIDRVNSPILFIPPHGGNPAHGYDATILPDICSVLIRAGHEKVLDRRLRHMAERAELLQHGFATLGIIGLVDEATGYQNVRARDALQAFLDKFLRKELAAWVKTFPDEFFKELFRLKKWKWTGTSRRPGVVGTYINDLIYDRLGTGILEELQRKNPVTEKGYRKSKHFQWLTDDIGHPALAQHMYATIGFMRAEENWDSFITRFHKAFPKKGENLALALDDN